MSRARLANAGLALTHPTGLVTIVVGIGVVNNMTDHQRKIIKRLMVMVANGGEIVTLFGGLAIIGALEKLFEEVFCAA